MFEFKLIIKFINWCNLQLGALSFLITLQSWGILRRWVIKNRMRFEGYSLYIR